MLVFASAPLWLLWFTHADVIGGVHGLEVIGPFKQVPIRPPAYFFYAATGWAVRMAPVA